HLRRWEEARHPAYFAQQVHNRSLSMGLQRLAESSAARLAQLARPALKLCWCNLRESPELERTLSGHEGWVLAVAVTAAGDRALSGSKDGAVRVWDLGSGQAVPTLYGHQGAVTAVAVTASGDRAVSASEDLTVRVWDLGSGQAVSTLYGHQGAVTAVAVTA